MTARRDPSARCRPRCGWRGAGIATDRRRGLTDGSIARVFNLSSSLSAQVFRLRRHAGPGNGLAASLRVARERRRRGGTGAGLRNIRAMHDERAAVAFEPFTASAVVAVSCFADGHLMDFRSGMATHTVDGNAVVDNPVVIAGDVIDDG